MAEEQPDRTGASQPVSPDAEYEPSYYSPSYERPAYASTGSGDPSPDVGSPDLDSPDLDSLDLGTGWQPPDWQPLVWAADPKPSTDAARGDSPAHVTAEADPAVDDNPGIAAAPAAGRVDDVPPGDGMHGRAEPQGTARLASSNPAMADMLPTTGGRGSGAQHSVWQAAVPDRAISGASGPATASEEPLEDEEPLDDGAAGGRPDRQPGRFLVSFPANEGRLVLRPPRWVLTVAGILLLFIVPDAIRFVADYEELHPSAPHPVWVPPTTTAASPQPTRPVQVGDVQYQQVGTVCGAALGKSLPGHVRAARNSSWCTVVVLLQDLSAGATPGPTDAVLSDGKRSIVADRALTLADDKRNVFDHPLSGRSSATYWFVVPTTFKPTGLRFVHGGVTSPLVPPGS